MILDKDKKREGLKSTYLNNIAESFKALKDTGIYVSCVFDVDLDNSKVMHYLATTNGKDIIVIQKDEFKYDEKFKREFLESSLAHYATEGIITVLSVRNHSHEQVPKNASTLKTISSANNILEIRNAEISYVNKIKETLEKVKNNTNSKLVFTNQNLTGIIDAIVLAFLVGVLNGGLLMIILKYVIK